MKNFLFPPILCVIALLIGLKASAQVSFGDAQKFNDEWLFHLKDDPAALQTSYEDNKWRKLSLPHDWSVEGQLSPSLASCTGYLPGGIGWYRKHFRITDGTARHYIYFEGVYNRSEVYLNGHLLGKRPNGYISFLYDMTPYLKEGDNVLSVRVDHNRSADSRWYTGSGIYRDVWLISAPEIHFAQWGIGWYAASLTDRQASIAVDMEVEKHTATADKLEAIATLYDAAGKQVAQRRTRISDGKEGITKVTLALKVANPHRWNLDDPYLYRLETELLRNGKRIDGSQTSVGLRALDFDPNKGFALNGKGMKVKGVCIHHDAGCLGSAVPPEVWERRLTNLKAIGVNAIRMSHNPQAPVVYDLCDRLGLLVMDEASDEWEFPKRKWIKGWNKGEPGYDGSFDFFEEWIERDVTDMVRRDRNHPCVFLWSIGNEVDYPNDPYSHPILNGSTINQPMFGGYKPDAPDAMRIGVIAKRLAACVRAVDRSRPVTGALAGVVMSNQTGYPEAIDVVGYNYTENRYDTDHAAYPDRVIYGSENGAGIDAWYAVKDKDFIFGQFIWTGTDYLGESGAWPSRGLNTGLLDFGSFTKPRGHFRASLWCEKPVTYIGTYPRRDYLSTDAPDLWNYEPGEMIRVVCYTNAPQARLLLDGKEVGAMKPYDAKTGIIYWDLPYQPGELRAEGCDEAGKTLSAYRIKSSGRPYALRVSADRASLSPDRSTAHLFIEVVDEEGTIVKLGDNEITCQIEGPARLLGLEGSNNTDMSDYTDNRHRAFQGRLLAYIQTTGEKGEIRVKFTSPLLQGTEILLNTSNPPTWALGGFVRPDGVNPVITPNPHNKFDCPMRKAPVGWEESDTFNPAAVVKDGKICVLYRAEDNSATGIGMRTSRIGLAESTDGVTMERRTTPVMFPAEDNAKEYEWQGGCEDPRVAVTDDGLYVMMYTTWNRDISRLAVATSRDLLTWEKHGPVFTKAYGGRFKDMSCKSGSIVTKLVNGKQVITKVNGKYLMYWGEQMVAAATSDDLINWTPVLNDQNELLGLIYPREKYFDSALTECGPPAIVTDKGILLLYNGKNQNNEKRDPRFNAGTYSAGQVLFDLKNPYKAIARLDTPFFRPMADFEKSGQYVDGTVFIEGLVFYKDKWFLYYGCADSQVGVAIYDPAHRTPGDPIK